MRKKRTSSQPEILVEIAREDTVPMNRQIEQALRAAVRSGRLPAGTQMPSTRTLANDLRVSRGVITEAYEQLIAEGYLVSRLGARTVVAAVPSPGVVETSHLPEAHFRFDFRPGVPDVTRFPVTAWVRSSRRALGLLQVRHLAYGDPAGTLELRSALAEYLARVRGLSANAALVLVCTGFAQALHVVARALVKCGLRRVAVEDPCHPEMRRILLGAGMNVCSIPVDDEGVRVDLLERTHAQAILVTPAHQFPTGYVLCAARRHELLAWAARNDAYIIEDDYDAEYRYDRNPLSAIQGLAAERVVYAGSASKILAPGLRLGWIVAPRSLQEALWEVKRTADLGSPTLEQLVYADFLRSGELDRHLRRMRTVYRQRRGALLAALARHCPSWEPQGAAAGLHLVATLPAGVNDREVAERAAAQSVRVYPMSEYASDGLERGAVVLGYGNLTDSEVVRGVARLARSIR